MEIIGYIVKVITSIPQYVLYVFGLIAIMPLFLKSFFGFCLTICMIWAFIRLIRGS